MDRDLWPAFAGGLVLAGLMTLAAVLASGCVQLKWAHEGAVQARRLAEVQRDRALQAEARAKKALHEALELARKEREARLRAETALQRQVGLGARTHQKSEGKARATRVVIVLGYPFVFDQQGEFKVLWVVGG